MKTGDIKVKLYRECVRIERIINSCEDLNQLENVSNWINFIFNTKYTNLVRDSKESYSKRVSCIKEIQYWFNYISGVFNDKNSELIEPPQSEKPDYPPIPKVVGFMDT